MGLGTLLVDLGTLLVDLEALLVGLGTLLVGLGTLLVGLGTLLVDLRVDLGTLMGACPEIPLAFTGLGSPYNVGPCSYRARHPCVSDPYYQVA